MLNQCHIGDCRELLKQSTAAGVRAQMCVTSPPYFGLRDYGVVGQIGLEPTPAAFVGEMVAVFRAVRDMLADDGTLWLNLGDSYFSTSKGGGGTNASGLNARRAVTGELSPDRKAQPTTQAPIKLSAGSLPIKPKDLIGIPWRVALALQADGWYLRQDIIWHKPNPMPESITDRCTKAHEYLFLLAKSERYFCNMEAIKEPVSDDSPRRMKMPDGWDTGNGAHGSFHRRGREKGKTGEYTTVTDARNKRSVWTIPTEAFSEAHFATFPRALIEPCILAGSRPGDVVLDPFMGSGTTAQVAEHLGRQWIGCELNPEYVTLQAKRLQQRAMAF
jgi:DNA modification methylase